MKKGKKKNDFEKILIFWKVNQIRISLAPTYLQSEWRIRDDIVLNKRTI